MTIKEAKDNGYTRAFDSYERGYISRKTVINDETKVYEGQGKRKGLLYYVAPCQNTTQYHLRCYLSK